MFFAKVKNVSKSPRLYYPFLNDSLYLTMAKAGSPKNTKNKAKHSKLMAQKKKKEREKKEAHKARLKALNEKIKAQKEE